MALKKILDNSDSCDEPLNEHDSDIDNSFEVYLHWGCRMLKLLPFFLYLLIYLFHFLHLDFTIILIFFLSI